MVLLLSSFSLSLTADVHFVAVQFQFISYKDILKILFLLDYISDQMTNASLD